MQPVAPLLRLVRRGRLPLLAGLLACAALAPNAQAAAAEKTPLQQRQEMMRKQTESSYQQIPAVAGTFKMAQLIRLRHEKGRWSVSTSAPKPPRSNSAMRLNVEGFDGICILSVYTRPGNNTGAPDNVSFTNIAFDDPEAIQVSTSINYGNGSLNIGRHVQYLDGYENVSLNQGANYDAMGRPVGGPTSVAFSVHSFRNNGQGITFQYAAPDFLTLRRRYGREVDRHLRPVFRRLQLESALAADPLVAWQVFADDVAPDPAVVARVRALLPALDSDRFQDRERALGDLTALGPAMALAIHHMDRSQLSDQQVTLIETAVGPYHPSSDAEALRLRNDVQFLLDCLYTDDQRIRELAWGRLKVKTGVADAAFDPAAEFEARAAAVDLLRQQLAGEAAAVAAPTPPATQPAPATRPAVLPRPKPPTRGPTRPQPAR